MTSVLAQSGYGFESSARLGLQASRPADSEARAGRSTSAAPAAKSLPGQLTPEEEQLVQQLKQTDRKVRAHEQAHISVGADLVRGGASYSYQTGPDDQRYAVAGEVSIDASPARTPEATIPKAQHIRAAALAPADPSSQDQSVAAQASLMEVNARAELAVQRREEAAQAAATPSTAAYSGQGNSGFYRGVERVNGSNAQVGAALDIFA